MYWAIGFRGLEFRLFTGMEFWVSGRGAEAVLHFGFCTVLTRVQP